MQRFLLLFSVLIVRTILFPIDGMDYDIYIMNARKYLKLAHFL